MTAAATTDLAPRPDDTGEVAVKPTAPQYMQGFEGMATGPFPEAARKVLAEPVDDAAVEIKPDGIVYVPGVYYRRQLTRAFGAGGWAIVPRSTARVMGDVVVYPGALYCLGRFVAEAVGECTYRQNSNMSYASCLEGAKTDALSRCCKDLGMSTELWDKAWRDRWQAQYAEQYWGEKWDGKKQAMVKKQLWRLRDGRPVQEIDMMSGAGGVAPATPKAPAAPPAAVPAASAVGAHGPAVTGVSSAAGAAAEPSRSLHDASILVPAASTDTGEALGAEGVAAVRGLVKKLGWKAGFARIWLKERFGVDSPDALSIQQGANAYTLLVAFGTPLYDRIHGEMLAGGEVLA